MAGLVKIVSPEGEWYEEIFPETATDLERAFGLDFDVSIDDVLEVFGTTAVVFGTQVSPESLKPDDRIIGTCHL